MFIYYKKVKKLNEKMAISCYRTKIGDDKNIFTFLTLVSELFFERIFYIVKDYLHL